MKVAIFFAYAKKMLHCAAINKRRLLIAMGRIITFVIIGVFVVGFPSTMHAQSWGPWKKRPAIAVVSVENDPRLPYVDKAVAFWNSQFINIGSKFRLGPISQTIGEIPADELRLSYPPERVNVISRLRRIEGDILIVMTDTMGSFAASLPPPGRKIVTVIGSVQHATISEVTRKVASNVIVAGFNDPLNVIAHELGHAIGLEHNSEDGTLMCGSAFCRRRLSHGSIYPLGDTDIRTLLTWYPRNWQPSH